MPNDLGCIGHTQSTVWNSELKVASCRADIGICQCMGPVATPGDPGKGRSYLLNKSMHPWAQQLIV